MTSLIINCLLAPFTFTFPLNTNPGREPRTINVYVLGKSKKFFPFFLFLELNLALKFAEEKFCTSPKGATIQDFLWNEILEGKKKVLKGKGEKFHWRIWRGSFFIAALGPNIGDFFPFLPLWMEMSVWSKQTVGKKLLSALHSFKSD